MTTDPLDQRMRQLTQEIAAAAPPAPELPVPTAAVSSEASGRDGRSLRHRGLLASLLLVALVAASAMLVARTSDDGVSIETSDARTPPQQQGDTPTPTADTVEESPQPRPTTIGPSTGCPPGFSFGQDTDGDGEIDTCYPAEIDSAKARWDAAGIDDYEFSYGVMGTTGMSSLVQVRVEDDVAIAVDVVRDGTLPTPELTVDDLFEMIETADDVREVDFDPVKGFPVLLSIDPNASVVDDEIRVFVSELYSSIEIDAAAVDLGRWQQKMAANIGEFPAGLTELTQRVSAARTNTLEFADTYVLHQGPIVEVYLRSNVETYCLVTAEVNPEVAAGYGGFSSSCQSATAFALDGTRTARSYDTFDRAESWLIMVPPARYIDQTWSVKVTAQRDHRVEIGAGSVAVIFAAEGPAEEAHVALRCACGDLNYSLQLSQAD